MDSFGYDPRVFGMVQGRKARLLGMASGQGRRYTKLNDLLTVCQNSHAVLRVLCSVFGSGLAGLSGGRRSTAGMVGVTAPSSPA